jgi:hypothetical protein
LVEGLKAINASADPARIVGRGPVASGIDQGSGRLMGCDKRVGSIESEE